MFSFCDSRPLALLCTLALGFWAGSTAPAVQARGESAWVLPRNSWYVESRAGYGFSNVDQQQAFLFDSHLEVGVIEAATLVLDIPAVTRRQVPQDSSGTVLVNNGFTDLLKIVKIVKA